MSSAKSKRRSLLQAESELDECIRKRDQTLTKCIACYKVIHPSCTDEDAKKKSSDYARLKLTYEKKVKHLEDEVKELEEVEEDRKKKAKERRLTYRYDVQENVMSGEEEVSDKARSHTDQEEDAVDAASGDDSGHGELDETEARSQIDTVKRSKLYVAVQGLRSLAHLSRGSGSESESSEAAEDESPSTMTYLERDYHKKTCYHYNSEMFDVVVGISGVLPKCNAAIIVLIMPFSDTFLGMEDEGIEYKPNYEPSAFVQIEQDLNPVSLDKLGDVCQYLEAIPDLVYKPQNEGDWYHFAYYYKHKRERNGRRHEAIRSLDLFSGAGGMSQGLHRAGLTTVCAVEKDEKASKAFKTNHPKARVENDVVECLTRWKKPDNKQKQNLGRIFHIHGSPPCQGFSGANINGGINDEANNKLSMEFVKAVEIFCPVTATFENVPGMWKRKNQHFLKEILVSLIKLGYQVRCCLLEACDYGDPQARPRLFILAAMRCAYLPALPTKTHGKDTLMHFVTVQDALEGVSPFLKETDIEFPVDKDRLVPNAPAKTICASKGFPVHHNQNRLITMDELKALFSLPPNFCLEGTERDKRRQLGNSVPVGLAEAVGLAVMAVLQYRYKGEELLG